MKKRFFLIVVFMNLFLITFITYSQAANFATSIGTTSNDIDTTVHINNAADHYDFGGYTNTRRLIDPSYTLLFSNLAAQVQFFATHGNVDNILFRNSGIRVGSTKTYGQLEYIGTNDVSLWENNTYLVTYAGCNTAGNGGLDENSITYVTAVKGAEAVVGFKDIIYTSSLENWADRYNKKLAAGNGVLDAVEYANKFIYVYDSVKDCHIVHHGNANVKIGSYHSNNSISDEPMNIDNPETILSSVNNIKATDTNIISAIKQKNQNFNENDYEITKRTCGNTNVLTEETVETEYIDFQLKIGDFYTNAGYTVKVNNGIIDEIYDNNVDIDKQEIAINNKEEYIINNTVDFNIDNIKDKAINQIKDKYSSDINIKNEISNVKYYYDIKNNKKYILLSVRSENHKDGSVGIAYDTVKYEI